MTLAISHREGNRSVLDCVLERKAPFNPDAVTSEFAQTLKSYRVSTVTGDRYAGEWPRERFQAHGITYQPAEMNRSELYLAFLPLLNSARVDLLDSPRMVAQFVGLERRTSRAGRDTVDHAPGAHDDVANAVAGALVTKPNESMNISEEILAMAADPRWRVHKRAFSWRVRAADRQLFHISGGWPMTARKLSGVIPMINKERDELRRALGRRTAAESALESARAATDRARAFLEEVVRLFEDHEAASMRASSSLVEEMKAAIASGGSPSADANNREMAKNDAARTALDARRQAAEQVVADLAGESLAAEASLERANEAVASAVRAVILAEAEKLAESWEAVEAEARRHRIRLGDEPISRLPGFSRTVGRAIYQNRNDDQFERPESEIARSLWTNFASALQRGDPDVQIDFSEADRSLEAMRNERAERRAADERFIARMRGEAA